MSSYTIPIFDLGIAVLPSELVPLHIFEEKYRRLVQFCLAQQPGEQRFGIINGPNHTIGTVVEIIQVLQKYEDGRSLILCHGKDRFRHIETLDETDYPVAEVNDYSDINYDSDNEMYEQTTEKVLELLSVISQDELPSFEKIRNGYDAFMLGAILALDNAEKQQLLIEQSESARLTCIQGLIDFRLALLKNRGLNETEKSLHEELIQ